LRELANNLALAQLLRQNLGMDFNSITSAHIEQALAQYQGNQSTSDFDLNHDLRPVAPKLRDAAVLIPIIERSSGMNVILTRRTDRLKHHPGQIAFPGGKVDKSDDSILHAALREADEEIGLSPSSVNVLGTLPQHETVSSFQVTPFVGMVSNVFHPRPEVGEVDEIFEVPLNLFLSPQNFKIHPRIWEGVERRYFAVPYGPYYTWGATARILRVFCDVIGGHNETIR
jgi:8-oxo-dGTP pyrophosphatase MutT (NUDIX family)